MRTLWYAQAPPWKEMSETNKTQSLAHSEMWKGDEQVHQPVPGCRIHTAAPACWLQNQPASKGKNKREQGTSGGEDTMQTILRQCWRKVKRKPVLICSVSLRFWSEAFRCKEMHAGRKGCRAKNNSGGDSTIPSLQ